MSYFSFIFMLLKTFNIRNAISAFQAELLRMLMILATLFKRKIHQVLIKYEHSHYLLSFISLVLSSRLFSWELSNFFVYLGD